MPAYFFNSLSHDEYSNLLIVVAFPNSPFSGKTSSLVKTSCLLTFPDDKSKNFSNFGLNKIELCFARFCHRLS